MLEQRKAAQEAVDREAAAQAAEALRQQELARPAKFRTISFTPFPSMGLTAQLTTSWHNDKLRYIVRIEGGTVSALGSAIEKERTDRYKRRDWSLYSPSLTVILQDRYDFTVGQVFLQFSGFTAEVGSDRNVGAYEVNASTPMERSAYDSVADWTLTYRF